MAGLLGRQSIGGLLGDAGNWFTQTQTANPEFFQGLGAGLLSGNMAAGFAQGDQARAERIAQEHAEALRREAMAQDAAQFGQTFGLQQQEFGLRKATLESEAQKTRLLQSQTAKFLEAQGAPPELVQMAQAGGGAEAFKFWQKQKNGGAENFGLSPVYGKDADGNIIVGQLGDNGTIVQSKTPEGFQPLSPYDTNYQKSAGTAAGKGQGEAEASLGGATSTAKMVNDQIASLKNDSYLPSMVGAVNSRLPNISSDAARVQSKIDQLQGGAFLQARQLLAGGGPITDFEGKKAEQAFIRMNTAQSETDFKAALDEFNDAVQTGLAKLQARAGGGQGAPRGPVSVGGYSIEQAD